MRQPIVIIARVLPDQPDRAAVRWTVDARFGFPEDGFELSRITNTGTTGLTVGLLLPGSARLASGFWSIDDTGLLADLASRTSAGVPMPDAARTLGLKPLLTFALPAPDSDVLQVELEAVALSCLDAHRESAELIRDFWQHLAKIPATADVAAMRGSAQPDKVRLYDAVIEFYREEAVQRLLAFASDFGTAKLLGLGFDDALPTAAPSRLGYEVKAAYSGRTTQDQASARQPNQPWPPPPTIPDLSTGDGLVGYAPFEPFFGTRLPRWAPVLPPAGSPNEAMFNKLAAAAGQGPRRWDSPIARLRWRAEPTNDDGISPDLPNLAVHCQVERFVHGEASVGEEMEPPRDSAAVFTLCHDGSQVPAKPVTDFSDDADLPWGALPMEGWYAYRVRGIDMFGIAGLPSAVAPIRLLDIYAPTPPAVRLDLERLEIPDGGRARLGCTIDWQTINEFKAPDARVFRIYQRWTPVEHVGLRIRSAAPAAAELGILLADAVVEDESGRPLNVAALAAFAGASLRATNADFQIRGPGALPSSLRVERSSGRIPELGGASALRAGAPIDGPMREIVREPAQAGALIIVDWRTLTFAISTPDPGSPGRIVPAKGKLYMHALGAEFDVMPSADGTRFLLQPPDPVEQRPAKEIFDALMQLPAWARTDFVGGSPTLFLPCHEIGLDLAPPPGANAFLSGTLRIGVSAADGVTYRHGPGGPGNESSCTEQLIPVRVKKRPAPPAWRPRKLWASDAASFAPQSTISLRWPEIPIAASYQLERAFEDALRRPASASDDDLLAHGATMAADPAFERVTERAFAPEWIDTLPGIAPARVIYRVRGVSVAGEMSSWVVVALVRVPDTRIPPIPNFLFARPPTDGAERVIACNWTQAGSLTGIGFIIEARDDGSWDDDVQGWRDIAELLPDTAAPGPASRFMLELAGQRPGCRQQLRVRAVRHALDPDDPLAQRIRQIRGPASLRLIAHATGTIAAPSDVSLRIDTGGAAVLRWASSDRYRRIEVQWRGPGQFGFERIEIAADLTEHVDDPLPEKGLWTYRLAAIGWGGRAVSDEVSAEWSAP